MMTQRFPRRSRTLGLRLPIAKPDSAKSSLERSDTPVTAV
jgi:hypothetical protein